MTQYDERQKFAVLQALGSVVIEETHDQRCRLFIRPAVEIKDRDVLRGPWWTGKFPSECIDSAFAELTNLPDGQYVVLDSMGPGRRGVRWNGFMWADVERRDPAAKSEAPIDLRHEVRGGPVTQEEIDSAYRAYNRRIGTNGQGGMRGALEDFLERRSVSSKSNGMVQELSRLVAHWYARSAELRCSLQLEPGDDTDLGACARELKAVLSRWANVSPEGRHK